MATIKEVVPPAEEGISYGIPTYKYLGGLVAVGATKKHVAFYTMSNAVLSHFESQLNGVTNIKGFQYGSAILQFDATGEADFLEIGRKKTLEKMAPHISHIGVHDHGFNNVSTYGNLLRLMREGKIAQNDWEQNFYELALKISGAVQGEGDAKISLLERAIKHIEATANFSVFYGEGRDIYDEWGRTAHECVFNVKDGNYRCPN
eukprot:gene32885-40598_t